MATIDLNLLAALDVLLTERSVTVAARRLGLSVSATSRTLTRLRSATGDLLLVQAGRSLVPTPYAKQLSARVRRGRRRSEPCLRRPGITWTRLCWSGRSQSAPPMKGSWLCLPRRWSRRSPRRPHVRLRFAPKPDKEAAPLRDGRIDLEMGQWADPHPKCEANLSFATASLARRALVILYSKAR